VNVVGIATKLSIDIDVGPWTTAESSKSQSSQYEGVPFVILSTIWQTVRLRRPQSIVEPDGRRQTIRLRMVDVEISSLTGIARPNGKRNNGIKTAFMA
jgi:hypothetical protein